MRLKTADASAVFIPLVLPQIGVITPEVLPVLAHIFEQIATTGVHEDQRDVAVAPPLITVLVEPSVAVVGPGAALIQTCDVLTICRKALPESMDGP